MTFLFNFELWMEKVLESVFIQNFFLSIEWCYVELKNIRLWLKPCDTLTYFLYMRSNNENDISMKDINYALNKILEIIKGDISYRYRDRR